MIDGIALFLSTDFLSDNRSGRLLIIVANTLFEKRYVRYWGKGRREGKGKGENTYVPFFSAVPPIRND